MGIHVVPSIRGWKVRRTKAKRALRIFSTWSEACNYTIDSVKPDEYIYLHDKGGRITDRI